MDVLLLFVSKTTTFDSLNSKHLEIFGFISIDFMCFSSVVFLEINFVFPKEKCVFFFASYSLRKTITTDTMIYNKR